MKTKEKAQNTRYALVISEKQFLFEVIPTKNLKTNQQVVVLLNDKAEILTTLLVLCKEFLETKLPATKMKDYFRKKNENI